jgi:hypothetical protein
VADYPDGAYGPMYGPYGPSKGRVHRRGSPPRQHEDSGRTPR